MFDLTVRPKADQQSVMIKRAFYSNERMIVYQAADAEPPRTSPRNRVPQSGSVLENLPGRSTCLE